MNYEDITHARPQPDLDFSRYRDMDLNELAREKDQAEYAVDYAEITLAEVDRERLRRDIALPEDLLQVTPVYQEGGNIYAKFDALERDYAQLRAQCDDLRSKSEAAALLKKGKRALLEKLGEIVKEYEELAKKSRIKPVASDVRKWNDLTLEDEMMRRNLQPLDYIEYVRYRRITEPAWAAAVQDRILERQEANPSAHLKGYAKQIAEVRRDVPLLSPWAAAAHVDEHISTGRAMIRARMLRIARLLDGGK